VESTAEELIPITVKVRPDLLAAIDSAYHRHGMGRGQFIRSAIAAELDRMAIPVSMEARLVPSRAGVGGQPTHRSRPVSKKDQKPQKPQQILIRHSVADDRSAPEENPFLAEEMGRASGDSAVGVPRRDPAGLPPAGSSGSADLRGQRVSNKESIQGVSAEVADVARASGIVANRIAGEMANERAARERSRLRRDTVASTSGSTGGPVPGAGPGSGPGRSVAARARTQSGVPGVKAVAPAKTPGRGRTKAG
jgi:hypothetical protein